MNKVVYVQAFFKSIYEEEDVKIPTGKFEKNLYGHNEEVIHTERKLVEKKSDSLIDGEKLSKDVEETIKKLNSDGYEIITTIPIVSGKYYYEKEDIKSKPRFLGNTEAVWGGAGFGYGYSFTEGVTIIARKINLG